MERDRELAWERREREKEEKREGESSREIA